MRSSKSRSRNKNRNRPQGGGNIVNRVFDSSGPEGKVRGTPAQIIEKYNQLARDAQLSGDRVALENFQQHSEHYTRMLAAAQKELDARQGQGGHPQQPQPAPQDDRQGGGQPERFERRREGGESYQPRHEPAPAMQHDDRGPREEADRDEQARRGRGRRERGDDRAAPVAVDVIEAVAPDAGPVPTPEGGAEAIERPRRARTRRKAPAPDEGGRVAQPVSGDPAA